MWPISMFQPSSENTTWQDEAKARVHMTFQ